MDDSDRIRVHDHGADVIGGTVDQGHNVLFCLVIVLAFREELYHARSEPFVDRFPVLERIKCCVGAEDEIQFGLSQLPVELIEKFCARVAGYSQRCGLDSINQFEVGFIRRNVLLDVASNRHVDLCLWFLHFSLCLRGGSFT